MPSLKIDIIVDDKGRPVIDRTTQSMRELHGATRQADASLKSHTGATNTHEASMAGLTRTILRLYAAYYVVRQGMEAVTGLLMQGVKAIDDYNLSVAKMAAMMTGMMEPNGKGLAEQYRDAHDYAKQLNVMIEQVDKNTLLTARDLREITEEMMKQGIVVDTNSKKQVEAFTNISNALAVIAAGAPNKEIQLRQEIRALLQGELRDTNQLAKMLDAQLNGKLKEQLGLWKTAEEKILGIGELLRGFAAAQGDINSSWEAMRTSLETIYEQVLRAGFQTAFKDITSSTKDLSDWAIQHKSQIAEILEKGYAYLKIAFYDIKNLAYDVWSIMKGYEPLLRTIGGLVLGVADGFGDAYARLRPIAEITGTILAGWLEIVTAVARFNPAALAVRMVVQGPSAIIKDAMDTLERGKAIRDKLKSTSVNDIADQMAKNAQDRADYRRKVEMEALGDSYSVEGWIDPKGKGFKLKTFTGGDDKAKNAAAQQREAMESWLEKAREMDPFLDEFTKKEASLRAEAEKLTRKWGEQAWITEGLNEALGNLELDRVMKDYEELGKKIKEFVSDEELATKAVMDFGYEGVRALEDIYYNATKNLQGFEDTYAAATENARNELQALLSEEKSFVSEGKSQFEELKDAIDGWGKDSAQAITDFCITGKASFSDMIESMIADLFKMSIYQTTTGPLFNWLSKSAGNWMLDLISPGGQSTGYGDWTGGLGFHGGGVVGYDIPAFTHPVPVSVFDNAPRFHSGMRPDEFPAILQKGEGVFTKNQMRAMGGGSSSPVNYTIINISAVDSQSFADAVKRNPASIVNVVNGSLKNNAYGLRNTMKRTR